jgi:hypothetical protein
MARKKKPKKPVRPEKRPSKRPAKAGDAERGNESRGLSATRVGIAAPPARRGPHDQEVSGSLTAPGHATPSASREEECGVESADVLRVINNVDRMEVGLPPMPSYATMRPVHATNVAETAAEQERRLKEAMPAAKSSADLDLMRLALWWAGGERLPRAAFVGRALHELKSFDEEFAGVRGTAFKICDWINGKNRKLLRKAMIGALDKHATLPAATLDSKLTPPLRPGLLVLERLLLLKAAYRKGVYLTEHGAEVFDGFPDWNTPDEPLPEKLSRPEKPPRS